MNIEEFINCYDCDEIEVGMCEDIDEVLKVWDEVDEIKEYSSESVYNELLNDKNKVLVLFYGDIGDGHGDLIKYILNRDNCLYSVCDCSNGCDICKVSDYDEFKKCICRDLIWREIYFEDLNSMEFESSCFRLDSKEEVLNDIYEVIDNKDNSDYIECYSDKVFGNILMNYELE